jgi:AcrR family transcriptional regulator
MKRSRSTTLGESAVDTPDARERILRTAYDLFSAHGVDVIGIDQIVAEAQVAKTTLYRHFRSKDELALAVLARREELWSREWLFSQVEQRAATPEGRLLAFFDVFEPWFARRDFEGCLFANTLLEMRGSGEIAEAAEAALGRIRAYIRELAAEAKIADPDGFAHKWQVLLLGSVVAASMWGASAADRARAVAAPLLEQEVARR